jgi:hypothetical protein
MPNRAEILSCLPNAHRAEAYQYSMRTLAPSPFGLVTAIW